jgi:glutaminase
LRKVHKLSNYESGSPETQNLNRETFKGYVKFRLYQKLITNILFFLFLLSVIAPNIVLIARAFRHQFIIPDFQSFTKDIEDIYWKCKSNTDGKVASYIPQLSRVSPDYWGVSVCTIDGQRFSIGDTTIPFTLQSCSKPLTYAIALEKLTQEVVHQYVGQEPSGRNFNELVLDHNSEFLVDDLDCIGNNILLKINRKTTQSNDKCWSDSDLFVVEDVGEARNDVSGKV